MGRNKMAKEDKKDAQKSWEYINRERATAQYRLQYGTKIIEQTQ